MASNQMGRVELGEGSLVELLQSAFRTEDINKIYRLSNEVDGALSIMLTACDISARVDAPDDKLARRVLVGTFCELSCRSPSFPRCLMLEVERLGEAQYTATEHADIYSGTLNGHVVDLRVPKAMQQCGHRILESRLFREDAAMWRTLPADERVIPFLGISYITVDQKTYVSLVSPKSEGEKLGQHIANLTREAVPDCEVVPLITDWIQELSSTLLHLHSNGIVHGRLCGDTTLLAPDAHIRLLGFDNVRFEYADITEEPTSGYYTAFLAPELLQDDSEGWTKLRSSASDVWAFGCVCVQLFNEGVDPHNGASAAVIEKEVKQGCYPPHTMSIPDNVWRLAEQYWEMVPERRPSMQLLVNELAEAQKRPRDFLSSVLVSLTATPSDNNRRQRILEEVILLVRDRNLQKVLDYNRKDAEYAFDILHEILTDCYSGRYNLPMGTRSTLRILLVKLISTADLCPPSLSVNGVKIIPGYHFVKTASASIHVATYQQRKVAIKCMLYSNGPKYRQQRRKLYLESIVWKTLPHERILPFIGIDTDALRGECAMVSPWMENGNARTYVEQHKGQGKDFRALVNKLLHQTALAVEFLHGEDIAHGDLRGVNVFIDPEGNALLADFGMAVLYGAGCPHFRLSAHDGHPAYISPERVNPSWYNDDHLEREYDENGQAKVPRTPPSLRSDIYAFGCLCIELYACEEPYGPIHRFAVAQKVIRNEAPQRPHRKGDEMPDVLWAVVSQCIERKDLSKRLRAKQVVEARIIDMV